MSLIGNIIWFVFGGLIFALAWFLSGLLLCVTIVGIPFGLQCFKVATLMLAPFGKDVVTGFDKHPIINILWAVLFGWEIAIGNIITGLLFCITIIGIPFGKQWFKFAILAFIPFGASID